MYGGLLGFAFSRNPSSLSTGVLYGGGLLALSTLSMKIWRQGKSSFPYILDQAGNFRLLSTGTIDNCLAVSSHYFQLNQDLYVHMNVYLNVSAHL